MSDIIEKVRNMAVPTVSGMTNEQYDYGYAQGVQDMLDDVVALLEAEIPVSDIEAKRRARLKFLTSSQSDDVMMGEY